MKPTTIVIIVGSVVLLAGLILAYLYFQNQQKLEAQKLSALQPKPKRGILDKVGGLLSGVLSNV